MADPVSEELYLPRWLFFCGFFGAGALMPAEWSRCISVCVPEAEGCMHRAEAIPRAGGRLPLLRPQVGSQSVCCFAQKTAFGGGSDIRGPMLAPDKPCLVRKWVGGPGRKRKVKTTISSDSKNFTAPLQ